MQQAAFDFQQAARRRDAGMARAQQSTEQDSPGWTEIAAEAIHRHAIAVFPDGFTTEEARAAIEASIPPASGLRAWGPVTRLCMKRKYIEPAPGEFRAAASSNGSPKQVYRLGAAS